MVNINSYPRSVQWHVQWQNLLFPGLVSLCNKNRVCTSDNHNIRDTLFDVDNNPVQLDSKKA